MTLDNGMDEAIRLQTKLIELFKNTSRSVRTLARCELEIIREAFDAAEARGREKGKQEMLEKVWEMLPTQDLMNYCDWINDERAKHNQQIERQEGKE